MVDVLIIGAGVTGTAIARELARDERTILVVEKELDVCEGTSKANSGIAHAGFDAKPGTLKAQMNVRGSRMMEQLSKELDFPYRKNGSLVLAFHEEDLKTLEELLERGRRNGVEDLRIITAEEVRALEPNVSEQVCGALYAPTGAIIDPFLMNVAFAENAFVNGADFLFGAKVSHITRNQETGSYTVRIRTVKGARKEHYGQNAAALPAELTIEARTVVNAAGVYADEIHNMVSARKIHITPRRGQYLLMDKAAGGFVSATVFQCPTAMGKGVLVTPTVHGNLLVGPDSENIEEKEGTNTTAASLSYVLSRAGLTADRLPARQVITSFAGLRAHGDVGDFLLEEAEDAPDFYDAACIESPGLTSAPAIGEYMAQLIRGKHPAPARPHFDGTRRGTPCISMASLEERQKLIEQNPAYANVVCRCELVTEGEIVDAITRPLGARTLDGIKRRVRAGMGRCQAGFCMPRQMELLEEQTGLAPEEIVKSGAGAFILFGESGKGVSV